MSFEVQVTPVLCDSVARWQEVVPVAAALRNPALQDRHWTKLQQELGVILPVGPAFTLQTLFDLKVMCPCPTDPFQPRGIVPSPTDSTLFDLKTMYPYPTEPFQPRVMCLHPTDRPCVTSR